MKPLAACALSVGTLVIATLLGACGAPSPDEAVDVDVSLYALVSTLDGVSFAPPLGPELAFTGAFDANELSHLRVALETTDAAGRVAEVASFDQASSPALRLVAEHEAYFVNLTAASYFTDPALAYRFRALLDGRELGRSDLSSRVFEVMSDVPALRVGFKLRIESRPAPVLGSIAPTSAQAGSADLALTVRGSGFSRDSEVRLDGAALASTFVSALELRATVPAASLASPGTHAVTVSTAAPGGGLSSPATLTVRGLPGTDVQLLLDAAASTSPALSTSGCTPATWADLGPSHLVATIAGCSAGYGWRGDGRAADPYRYALNGVTGIHVADAPGLAFTGAMTIEMWINASSIANHPMLVSKMTNGAQGWRGFYTEIWGGALAFVVDGNTGHTSTHALSTNTWYQLAVTYDGRTERFYVNGTPTDVFTETRGVSTTTMPVEIADWSGLMYPGSHTLAGAVAAVGLWGRVRSAAEIFASCELNAPRFPGVTCGY